MLDSGLQKGRQNRNWPFLPGHKEEPSVATGSENSIDKLIVGQLGALIVGPYHSYHYGQCVLVAAIWVSRKVFNTKWLAIMSRVVTR